MTLEFRQKMLHYELYGTGTQWVLALHGYGEEASGFRALATEMGEQYRFICLDLPYHGQTTWAAETVLPTDLIAMMKLLMTRYSIDSLTLAGYSMGGRVALTVVQAVPELVSEVWLIAPDGWKLNPWYQFATQTSVGNRIFKLLMRQPNYLIGGMKLARSLRLLHRSQFKFACHFLADPAERKALYTRWTAFRKCHPNREQLVAVLKKHKIRVFQFYGELDRIIPPYFGQWISKALPNQVSTHVLKSGHRLLDPSIAPNIARAIQTAAAFHPI